MFTYQAQGWYTNTTCAGQPSWHEIGEETTDYERAKSNMLAEIAKDVEGSAERAYRIAIFSDDANEMTEFMLRHRKRRG